MDKNKKPPRRKNTVPTVIADKPEPSYGAKKDEPLILKILAEIELGMNINKACMLHDLDDSSWRRWRTCKDLQEDGYTDLGIEKSIDDRRCWKCTGCALQKRCDTARLRYIKVHHEKVATATIKGEDVWTASAWLLERTEPDTYANKTKQEITHNLNAGNNNAQKLVAAIIGGAKTK